MTTGNEARGRWSWALYDWANSPFTTLIITFIFPAYFQAGIVKDAVAGQALWGYAIAASGLLIALTAPVLGAIADASGRRKPLAPSRSPRYAPSPPRRSGSQRRRRPLSPSASAR